MIVNKILKNGEYVPNLPAGWLKGQHYKEHLLNSDGTYTLFFEPGQNPNQITALQGVRELKSRTLANGQRLYDAVKHAVDNSNNEDLQDFFYRAPDWYKDTPEVISLAQSFGVDVDDFFTKAKGRNERL
jgi:hypothetical protein